MPFPSLPSPPTLFPTYLVPSLPFRRRQSSTDSTASTSSGASSASNATAASSSPPDDSYLSGNASHLRCARCLSDLALSSQIISKGFTGRHGRAYLVAPSSSAISGSITVHDKATVKAINDALPNLPNTYTHKPVPRQLVTGPHTVGDISCSQCGSVLGWKYVEAKDESQHYKIGKFILETKRVCRSSTWDTADDVDDDGLINVNRRNSYSSTRRRSSVAPPSQMPAAREEDEIEFDSQDEDECDALFAGGWTPAFAKEHRMKKGLKRLDE